MFLLLRIQIFISHVQKIIIVRILREIISNYLMREKEEERCYII